MAALLAEYQIPSAALGVVADGEVTTVAVGDARLSPPRPATTETVYQCGSLTKTFTALAFMRLVDEGKVDLDRPVRTYLPDFAVADADTTARLTPRQLLNHTNGIEEAFGDPGEDTDVYRRMVDNIADAPQVQPLGHTHGYSAALGYAILARVMEVVEDKPWDAIMAERLFAPMGLTSTNTWREQVDPERAATGYILRSIEEGPIETPIDHLPRSYGPGGNITSTIGEVLTLARVILDGGTAPNGNRIVSATAVKEMMESRVPIPDPYMFGPYWGLGLITCDWDGHTVYAHDGSTIGQNARLRILPEQRLAIALLTNGGPRESFYKRLFNEILPEFGAPTVPELPQPDPDLVLDPSRYEGVYERPGARFEVRARDGGLGLTVFVDPEQAAFLGQPERITYPLLPVSPTHFLMPSDNPLEDTQTVAIHDFADGRARYLHTNCRLTPRTGDQ